MGAVVKGNVPELRFGGFFGAWEKSRLEKHVSLISGQHLSPEQYSDVPNGLPYFTGPSDFTNSKSSLKKWSLVKSKVAQKNDVLITVKGNGVGELWFLELSDVAMGRQLMAIRAEGSSGKLIYYFLGTQKNQFVALGSGNMIPGLSRDDVLQTKLSLPSLLEQQKIAVFLGAVDAKLMALRRKRELLQEYKRGMMQKIFSRELRFKGDDGVGFPDWVDKRLGDVAEKPQYGMNKAAVKYDGSAKYIRITDIDADTRQFKPTPVVSPSGGADENYRVGKGDLLFARTGASVGKSYLYDEADGDLFFAGFLIRFSLLKDKVEPPFIFLQTQLKRYRKWVVVMSMRSGQPGINAEEYGNMNICVPCLTEQQKIADFLSAIDSKIESVAGQIAQVETFKKGLLQKMFV